jgi:phospholipid/cholesterol/gamma-HCH transport system permease protein
VADARGLYSKLRTVARRRDVRTLVLDFSRAGRIDSSGVAVVSLISRQLASSGKQLDLSHMTEQHRAALALAPEPGRAAPEPIDEPGALERVGDRVLGVIDGARSFAALVGEIVRQTARVATRQARLPAGTLRGHLETMGVNAIFIVSLLSFLTGMTMAFQGAVQLQRFGAGVFVADMIGMSMVRELVPLMTAVIITGRTGAAIAAELGTMRVRSEIDALETMGINPVRFLIVPRMLAITVIGPSLTLIGIFVGMLGGMLVATARLDMPAVTFWSRIVDRVEIIDFLHGLGKSLVFSWIIGLSGSALGMRARGDASSVGSATTRTVVTSVFFIVLVDAVFATITTFMRHG